MKPRLIFTLASLTVTAFLVGQQAPTPNDSDGDGMDDAWEVMYGLNPNDASDAFADLDGDRVPNLWEYQRGSRPNDANSTPAPDAYVDANRAYAEGNVYPTLQEAYDSVQQLFPIIQVEPAATIRCKLSTPAQGATTLKTTLWLAAPAPESVVLRAEAPSDSLDLREESVWDGFVIEPRPGVLVSGPALWFHPASSGGPLPECRLVNTLFRRWSPPVEIPATTSWPVPGAILNDGGSLTLLHTTVSDCAGLKNVSGQWLRGGPSVENRSGLIGVINSIIWSRSGPAQSVAGDLSQVTSITSICQGGAGGAASVDPALTLGGYLTTASSACVGTATRGAGGSMVLLSVTGWPRASSGTVADKGADHWRNTDADTLPDWWEAMWFGTQILGSLDDPDADGLTNEAEFLAHTSPISARSGTGLPGGIDDWGYLAFAITGNGTGTTTASDTDGDGLSDSYETTYFGGKQYRNGRHDADEDGLTDAEEATSTTNYAPLLWDKDGNGRRDVIPTTAHGTGSVVLSADNRAGQHLAR